MLSQRSLEWTWGSCWCYFRILEQEIGCQCTERHSSSWDVTSISDDAVGATKDRMNHWDFAFIDDDVLNKMNVYFLYFSVITEHREQSFIVKGRKMQKVVVKAQMVRMLLAKE